MPAQHYPQSLTREVGSAGQYSRRWLRTTMTKYSILSSSTCRVRLGRLNTRTGSLGTSAPSLSSTTAIDPLSLVPPTNAPPRYLAQLLYSGVSFAQPPLHLHFYLSFSQPSNLPTACLTLNSYARVSQISHVSRLSAASKIVNIAIFLIH